MQHFDTFTITIKGQPGSYVIEASGPKGIRVQPQPFHLSFSPQQQSILASLATEKAGVSPNAIQEIGRVLYKAIFTDQILLAYGQTQGRIRAGGVRLQLQVDPPELAALPWEAMYDGQEWLTVKSDTPLVRGLPQKPGDKTLQKLQVRGALKILFVGASPADSPSLEIEATAKQLQQLLREDIDKKRIVFDVLLNATLDGLRQQLVKKEYHLLYFAGHGGPEGIYLDDGSGDEVREGKTTRRLPGDKYPVLAQTLVQTLEGKPIRLVFLAACNTAAMSDKTSGLLTNFAQELTTRAKLPALVAMQYFIGDMQANQLTAHFFTALAAFHPVDVALAEARKALARQGQVGRDVIAPVMYLQAKDGALFQKVKNWPAITFASMLFVTLIVGSMFLYRFNISRQIAESTVKAEATAKTALGASNNLADLSLNSSDPEKSLRYATQSMNILAETKQPVLTQVQIALLQSLANPLRAVFEGHSARVNIVEFSPNGRYVATGSDDNTVRIWNVETRDERYTLNGHTGPVITLNFSPDGRYVATGSADNTARIWEIETGQEQVIMAGHNAPVIYVHFSLDGRYIITGSEDGTARVWEVKTGSLLHTLAGHSGSITAVSISPNGRYVATGSEDYTVRVWELETGQEEYVLRGDSEYPISNVRFSPDSRYLVTTGAMVLVKGKTWDPTIRIWDIGTGETLRTINNQAPIRSIEFSPDGRFLIIGNGNPYVFPEDTEVEILEFKTGEVRYLDGHRDSVTNISFSPNGRYFATSSEDGIARVWEFETRAEYIALKGHEGCVNSVSFSPDGNYIVTGSDDTTVRLWAMDSGLKPQDLIGHTGWVNDLSFSPDGKYLATVSDDMTVRFWNIHTGQEMYVLKGYHGQISNLSFSPDGQFLATVSADNTVRIWDVETKTIRHILTGPDIWSGGGYDSFYHNVSFSPDGSSIVVGGYVDNSARIWDVHSGKEKHVLIGHEHNVSQVSFSHDGCYVITVGSHDATACIWNALNGQKQTCLYGHNDQITGVSFSPNDQYVVTGSSDKTARIWDVETGQVLHILEGHSGPITSLSVSPDSRYVSTGSTDGTARIWDIEQGLNLHILAGHKEGVYAVGFSPDSHYLITGGRDTTARLWDVESGLQITTLTGHKAHISLVSFSPDGYYIAAASSNLFTARGHDYTVRLWKIPVAEEMVVEANYRIRPSWRTSLSPSIASLSRPNLNIQTPLATRIPENIIPSAPKPTSDPNGLSRLSGKWVGTTTETWPKDTDVGNGTNILTENTFLRLTITDAGNITVGGGWSGRVDPDLELTMYYRSATSCEGKSGIDEYKGSIKKENGTYKLYMETQTEDDPFCFGSTLHIQYELTKE